MDLWAWIRPEHFIFGSYTEHIEIYPGLFVLHASPDEKQTSTSNQSLLSMADRTLRGILHCLFRMVDELRFLVHQRDDLPVHHSHGLGDCKHTQV